MKVLDLLDVETTFELEKTTTQVKAILDENLHGYLENLSDKEVSGYEIHMGITKRNENSE